MEMSELNNRINVTMRRYAAVTTIMLPLTLITGILGMNVPLPSDVRLCACCGVKASRCVLLNRLIYYIMFVPD
jgi:Mg2+ and Co2+ transporter CorA